MWKLIFFGCLCGLNSQIVTSNLSEGNSASANCKSEFEKFKVSFRKIKIKPIKSL